MTRVLPEVERLIVYPGAEKKTEIRAPAPYLSAYQKDERDGLELPKVN